MLCVNTGLVSVCSVADYEQRSADSLLPEEQQQDGCFIGLLPTQVANDRV